MRIFILLLIFLLNIQSGFASTPVKFIYLNGANANTSKDKMNFINGINNAHIHIKNTLETSNIVKQNMLQGEELYIDKNPVSFFWGYESQADLNNMDDCLISMKMISPRLAQTTRSILSHCMHDAIWVQKTYNMQHIINNLHKCIMNAYANKEKVVLLGHSAGSFITYEYLIHKLPCINPEHLISALESKYKTNDKFFRVNKVKPTCVDAITESGLAIYSTNGDFVAIENIQKIKGIYKNLDKYTDLVCTPQDEFLGVINFGSPLVLFYSDYNNQNIAINKFNKVVYEYLQSNDMFFLTVNFADDPLGFPVSKNYSADEMLKLYNLNFSENGKGFTYNKSDVKSPAPFMTAHTSYWQYPKKFAKLIKDAYEEGLKNFYPRQQIK